MGIECEDMSVAVFERLKSALGEAIPQDVTIDVKTMKMVKDQYEIENIRRSAFLVDAGVETAIRFLGEGFNEAAACTQGQYAMRRLWSENFPKAEVCGF
ncbi:MAG: aminopeptidase P family protein, partial [Oscillospiraceae bacterium]